MTSIYQFVSGAAMFGAWTSGVLFLGFWSKTKDRLFLIFALSFWLMGLERAVLLFTGSSTTQEDHSGVYLIRLLAFLLILWAIVDKNRQER